MDETRVIIPSRDSGYVSLARTKQGRLFRKHLLSKGTLIHPTTKEKLSVDDAFMGTLVKNFEAGVCDIVQVPLAGDSNEHTEDPTKNVGEVIGLEVEDDKLYALMDIRDETAAPKFGKTLLGASAMLHLDYTDTRSGDKVGPTLLHACVTNRPYCVGLDDYEELVAATADGSGEAVVLTGEVTTEEPQSMDLEQIKALLKDKHSIDLDALVAKAAEADAKVETEPPAVDEAALTAAMTAALKDAGLAKLTASEDETVSAEDIIQAVAELAQENVTLTATNKTLGERVGALETDKVKAEVAGLVRQGRVLPVQAESMVELALSNRAMFDKIIPAQAIVKLENEVGVQPEDPTKVDDVEAEVARLANVAKDQGYVRVPS